MADPANGASGRRAGGALSAQPTLVERTAELAILRELVDAAIAGDGRAVLVEGPAGIGKTRLLAELRRHGAQAGAHVLAARGSELERSFPFGAVRQLFEAPLAAPDVRAQALAGAAAPAADVLGMVAEAGADGPPANPSFAALHGLFWVAVNLAADRPLVLAIDDLQWCDPPSLRFLAYLVHRLEGLPILLAATVRTGDAAGDEALLGELSHDPATVALRPAPLSQEAVRSLIEERLGADPDRAFCQACHRSTGGNPLLLRELLTALQADDVVPDATHVGVVIDIGPRAVSRTVLLRLARLSPGAVAVARAVAVLGEAADLATVAAMSELGEREVADATAALSRADILAPASTPLAFVHPLVRSAVYGELPPGERELAHARAAAVLRAASAPAELVGAQLLHTVRRGEAWVADVLREAGRSAARRGAPESAVAYLQRALDEPPAPELRPWILFELGISEGLVTGPSSAAHLMEAYESLVDLGARAICANVLARFKLFLEGPESARRFARRAASELPDELAEARALLEGVELCATQFGVGSPDEMRRLDGYRTRPVEDLRGPGDRALAGLVGWDWMRRGGPPGPVVELALAAIADGQLIAADNGLLSVLPLATLADLDHPDTLELWELALADAHRRGSVFSIISVHIWRGHALMRRGELTEAEESMRSGIAEFAAWGSGEAQETDIYLESFLALILVGRGDLVGARAALERCVDPGGPGDNGAYYSHAELEILLGERRVEEAVAAAVRFGARFPHFVNPSIVPLGTLHARALAQLGRREEAIALAREEVELAREVGGVRAQARALRVLGTLEEDAGLPHLQAAVAVVEGTVARLEYAEALAALGTALRRARRPADAREPLRRALEVADSCGAVALAETARAELHATGARPRTTAARGVDALTASERRVVQYAAEGGTNRDIAQVLFVTPKTVEVHLSNAYRKLGVRSRRELQAALAGST